MMSHEMKVTPVTELKIGNSLEDQNVLETIPLISPREIKRMIPVLNPEIVQNSREIIGNILHGRDPRKLVIVGPCSIHDEDAAIEYAHGIKDVQAQTKDELFIVMRAYFEKPQHLWAGQDSCTILVLMDLKTCRKDSFEQERYFRDLTKWNCLVQQKY